MIAPLNARSSSSSSGGGCPCSTPACAGSYQFLANYSGLIHIYDYDPASGYAIRHRIRQGQCGCDNKLWEKTYTAFSGQGSSSSSSSGAGHSSGSSSSSSSGPTTALPTVYVLSSLTLFRDDITVDASQSYKIVTSFAYTWYPGTVQVQSTMTTWPVVSTAQNGSGVADTRVDFVDFVDIYDKKSHRDNRGHRDG